MESEKKVAICTISDISTDYRLHKIALTISKNNLVPYIITRKRKDYINKIESFHYKVMNMYFEKGPMFYIEYNIRLFFTLLFNPPYIIYSVDLDTLTGSYLAKIFINKPLIFDSHEYFPESPELQHRPGIKKIWQIIEKIFVPKIDYGITVCKSIADIYKEKYNKSFKVIRNMPLAQHNKETKQTHRNKENNKTFTLIYQGAVNIGRGIQEVIESLLYVENVKLIIAGKGDIFDDMKKKVEELSLNDRIQILGKIPFEKLADYTLKADLGLILLENMGLNYYYSLPNRVFDFIKYEVPILATDFPEIKNIVEKYDVGLCISSLDPKVLASTINKIKDDKKQIESWKNNERKAALELTWENEENNFVEILNDIYNS